MRIKERKQNLHVDEQRRQPGAQILCTHVQPLGIALRPVSKGLTIAIHNGASHAHGQEQNEWPEPPEVVHIPAWSTGIDGVPDIEPFQTGDTQVPSRAFTAQF